MTKDKPSLHLVDIGPLLKKMKNKREEREKKRTWVLEQGLELIAKLEAHLDGAYHVALAGSVLINKISTKDIDLIIFPHVNGQGSLLDIQDKLKSFGMELIADNAKVSAKWEKEGSVDTKLVEVWRYNKKRVDIFMPWIESN